MSNNITNQELLTAINNGFTGVQKQFTEVNERLDKTDKRFDKMDERFNKTDKENKEHFNKMDIQFIEVTSRLANIENNQENSNLRMSNMAYDFEIKDLQARVRLLEKGKE